jgi:hypothetical protein
VYLVLAPVGRISAEADPTRLAYLLLSAFQGGMLLAQVARDIAPLKEALQAPHRTGAICTQTRYGSGHAASAPIRRSGVLVEEGAKPGGRLL